MKLLLTAVNAKYIHSNPAIYCLQSYAAKYKANIELAEYTINQSLDDILRSIYEKHPDVLAISCYIWNMQMVEQIIREYKKLDPQVDIWVGGPEVSYDATACLIRLPELKGVMIGEGEETFLELIGNYVTNSNARQDFNHIKGIAYRDYNQEIQCTEQRQAVDFSRLPFLYQFAMDLHAFEHRIIYYETSRGCPFSCSYCLSSIDKRVRFRDLDLVYQELQLFLDKMVPQVKFIDRTFNCNKNHAMSILRFIKEHDNGVTNFHFEIAADLLDEEQLEFLATLRPGLIQLEIGVQSTNQDTIKAIHRHMDLKKVADNVAKVKEARNIHQHLDLIAGLPYEDYSSFQQSFDEVYAMCPDQLQLGFLKVLKGSLMGEYCKEYNIAYHSEPPYEVLYTQWLPYSDVCKLKDLEEMVEVYYNSGQFTHTIQYLEHFYESAFSLYESLAQYYRKNELFDYNQSRLVRYTILMDFAQEKLKKEELEVLSQLMTFDLYLREKLKGRPAFTKPYEQYKKDYKSFLSNHANAYGFGERVHIEHFTHDIFAAQQEGIVKEKDFFILFDYSKEKSIFGECSYTLLEKQASRLVVVET